MHCITIKSVNNHANCISLFNILFKLKLCDYSNQMASIGSYGWIFALPMVKLFGEY